MRTKYYANYNQQSKEVYESESTCPEGVAAGMVVVSWAALKSVNVNGSKVAPHSAI